MHARQVIARGLLPALCLVGLTAAAEESRWEVGVRTGISSVGGKPANDIPGSALTGKYRLGEGSYLGLSIERLKFDFERPWKIVGVEQNRAVTAAAIDATVTSTVFSAFYERVYGGPTTRWNRYWNAGLGFASPDAGSVTGPAVGGGSFNIVTDAGNEVIPSVSGGVRYYFTRDLAVDLGLSASRHFADWKVTDRVSGRTGTIDDYTRIGIHLGLTYRF